MIVPIYLFSGLTNYSTQTLATIHVAYSHSVFCSKHIEGLSLRHQLHWHLLLESVTTCFTGCRLLL